jgi:hypothetical protein
VGDSALVTNTTGVANIAIGGYHPANRAPALNLNTTGSYNIAMGCGSLTANTTGSYNVSIGWDSIGQNLTGTSNTAVGYQALTLNTASSNTAVGTTAGYSNTTGTNNNFFGAISGYSVSTGSNNLALGSSSGGNLTTGSNNIYVGYSFASSASVTTEVVMAFGATGKGTGTSYIQGSAYQTTNATTWSTTSDQRIKKNIVDNNTGLGIINQIQVRNFEYRLPEEITDVPQDQAIKKTGVQLGVIAQELQQILPECVKTESTGVMTVDADNLTWYLVNAVKQLSAEVESLKSQLKGA